MLLPKYNMASILKHKQNEDESENENYYRNIRIEGNGLVEKYFQFKKQFDRK